MDTSFGTGINEKSNLLFDWLLLIFNLLFHTRYKFRNS